MKIFKTLILLGLLFGSVVLVSSAVEAETSKDEKNASTKDEKKVDEPKEVNQGGGGRYCGRCCYHYGRYTCGGQCCWPEESEAVENEPKEVNQGGGGSYCGRCCYRYGRYTCGGQCCWPAEQSQVVVTDEGTESEAVEDNFETKQPDGYGGRGGGGRGGGGGWGGGGRGGGGGWGGGGRGGVGGWGGGGRGGGGGWRGGGRGGGGGN